MNSNGHFKLIWIFRILFFVFFFLSAFSKIYPNPNVAIHLFEKGQFLTMGIPICPATWLSRLLISLEFAISIGFILPYFFRKITLPFSILLLLFFTIYLLIEVFILGKKDGNCGCFGQLIPMTPPVSLLKNIIALIPLFYIYIKKNLIIENKRPMYLYVLGYVVVFLIILIISPQVCLSKNIEKPGIEITNLDPEISSLKKDFPSITQGKQILCYFSPTCSHCMETAKLLDQIKDKTKIKNYHIIFMNESNVQSKINQFIKTTGIKADYKIIEFIDFPSETDPPAVLIIENGKISKRFFGKDKNKFEKNKFIKAFNS